MSAPAEQPPAPASAAPDGGTPDGGTPDGGTPVGGTPVDEAVTDAHDVAREVRSRLDAGHQDPEDVRAAAHMRWPEHPLTIDETVDAALHGQRVVVVHEEESSGQDALVDPHLHGLEADDDGLIDAEDS